MRGPLVLLIESSGQVFDVTDDASGLSFTRSAFGGNVMASVNIDRDPHTLPTLGPADLLTVLTNRGRVVFDGYLNNPGEFDGPSGVGLSVTALGGATLAGERAERLIYRDTDLGSWMQDDATGAQEEVQVEVPGRFPDTSSSVGGRAALFIQVPKGSEMTSGAAGLIRYRKFEGSPMTVGAMRALRDCGVTSTEASYRIGFMGADFPANASNQEPAFDFGGLDPTATATEGYVISTHEAGYGAYMSMTPPLGTITKSWYWFGLSNVSVLGKPVNRFGVSIPCPRATYVLAHEVFADLLGRMLPLCDPNTAEIATTSFQIETLAFIEPTTVNGVMDELLRYEDYIWGIGNRNPNGLHHCWFRPWPTQARYMIDDRDTLDLPGSDDVLSNRIAVSYVDSTGAEQTVSVGAYVPKLGSKSPILNGALDPTFVGRIKDAEKVTLPAGRGSRSAALQVGAMRLADVNAQVYAGTVVIDRPKLDYVTGAWVDPHEIKPGEVAHLASLGVDVRITEMTYDDDGAQATLKLNSPQRTTEELLARL